MRTSQETACWLNCCTNEDINKTKCDVEKAAVIFCTKQRHIKARFEPERSFHQTNYIPEIYTPENERMSTLKRDELSIGNTSEPTIDFQGTC